ncbi:MAG: ribose 5-phosphate isomerase B [Clostridia bacterium]|nr:ribose 5-phosphate isomerase B [Clostridia bacterium]
MIAIGSDHAGFFLKKSILRYFKEARLDYIDFGPDSDDSVDFPDYAEKTAVSVASGQCEKGILICGTGIGMSIAANKIPGIRAALCTTIYHARLSRQHNNANILALGARTTGSDLALAIVREWLETEYLDGRYELRNQKIRLLEEKSARRIDK